MIMNVACFFSQHSPTFGQPASSQTVTSLFSRTMRFVSPTWPTRRLHADPGRLAMHGLVGPAGFSGWRSAASPSLFADADRCSGDRRQPTLKTWPCAAGRMSAHRPAAADLNSAGRPAPADLGVQRLPDEQDDDRADERRQECDHFADELDAGELRELGAQPRSADADQGCS